MSRIGRAPITIPAGVDINIADGNVVTVKGPKGTLTKQFSHELTIEKDGNEVKVSRPDDSNLHRSLHGLTRTLLHNMVEGVTNGFSKTLEIAGVGYRAKKTGKKVVLTLGFSHPVEISETDTIKLDVPDATTIVINGIDKQEVGQYAAEVREKRPPEPYKGKGIHYKGEHIIRKEGKAGKAKK